MWGGDQFERKGECKGVARGGGGGEGYTVDLCLFI